MVYGREIGRKFYKDGSVRTYPGNTVVSDVTPACSAYGVMCQLRKMVQESELADHFILLPEDSYHMTMIRGVNDQVRKPGFWPEQLSLDAPMEQVDDHVSAAIMRAGLPGTGKMKFREVSISTGCMIVKLDPVDEQEEKRLRDFRDRAAQELGLRFATHDSYTFHISLAYTRLVAEGEKALAQKALKERMDAYIQTQPPFETGPAYMAYYTDMLAFFPTRVKR